MPKVEKKQSGSLGGGSQGEFERQYGSPFFHPGIKTAKFVVKNIYEGRILPAHDRSIPTTDPAFLVGFVPYRDTSVEADPKTGNFPFTAWYYMVKGYEFMGKTEFGFLSPLSLLRREERGIDPIYDAFLTAKNHTNLDFKNLTMKPTNPDGSPVKGEYSAILEPPRKFALTNDLLNVDGNMENRVVIFKSKSLDTLKDALNFPRPATVKDIVSPDWPDYLYGDPTDPLTGLLYVAKRSEFGDAGMETVCRHFSTHVNRLTGSRNYPIDPTTQEGADILAGRVDIADVENVTKIMPAEAILDIIVNDGFLPYELIQEACEKHWTMPPKPVGRTYSLPGQAAPDDAAEDNNTLAARSAPRPAPAAVAGRPAPSAVAPRPAAPGATARPAPRPAAPAATAVARPAPVASASRPVPRPAPAAPAGAVRPAPVQQAAAPRPAPAAAPVAARPTPRVVAPTPSPAALAPDDTAAEAEAGLAPTQEAAFVPPTQEEIAWWNEWEQVFATEPNRISELSAADMSVYVSIGDRISAMNAQAPQQ